jgi:hypothetical protein
MPPIGYESPRALSTEESHADHAIPDGMQRRIDGIVKRDCRLKRRWVEASQEKEEDVARSAGAPTARHSTRFQIAFPGRVECQARQDEALREILSDSRAIYIPQRGMQDVSG